jgi:hypothetical protein
MALAELIDVETMLGRSLSTEDADKAEMLLNLISSAIANEAGGFRFEPGDYTVTRKVHNKIVRLPARVAEVTEVRSFDRRTGLVEVLTGWVLRRNALYAVDACEVEVDFTVTDEIPADIVTIAALMAVGSLSTQQGVTQSVAGMYSQSYVDSAGRVWFSAVDKATIARYRPVGRAVQLL